MLVCPRCGFGQMGAAKKSDDYWTREDGGDGQVAASYWTDARAGVFRGALELLEENGARGRILDLGGGVGHFAEIALTAGWDAYSLDVSELAVAAAAERIGVARSLSTVPAELAGTCDAVTLWCVIAHVRDPRRVLAEAIAALRPGGQLFITTPNFTFQIGYATALARLDRPIDFSAHDHLLHFTTESLARTLEAAGLSSWRLAFVGVTEDCVADPRMARWAVPAKRLWNRLAFEASRAGLPYLGSELQVVGTAP